MVFAKGKACPDWLSNDVALMVGLDDYSVDLGSIERGGDIRHCVCSKTWGCGRIVLATLP